MLETVSTAIEKFNYSDWLHQRAWVEVNLSNLAQNIREIKGYLAEKTDLMAIVKADAYGHGAVTVANTVLENGATWLGVATIPEGIELREAGIKAPILILGLTHTTEQIRAMVFWKLEPTLCTEEQVLQISQTLENDHIKMPVHIKLDTGMSRLGISWQKAQEFVKLVSCSPNLEIASIYSHFATADSEDQTIMRTQTQRFKQAIGHLQTEGIKIPRLHLANSAGTLTDKTLHYDMVRVGLAMYGLYPATHLQKQNYPNNDIKYPQLKPVLEVKARITQIKTITKGTGISYGHNFIAEKDMQIAIVGIGYADGIPRKLSNQMHILIKGQKVKQLGSITMDQIMIDVSDISDIKTGEIVTILGTDGNQQILADHWAEILDTISWEILCGFKHRLPRIAV
jgi:alanine racemase